jgi:hypothetical protein
MKSSNSYTAIVKCPFCDAQVDSKMLADHAKQYHAGEQKKQAKADRKASTPIEGFQSTKPVFMPGRTFFVDESGVVINPRLLPKGERPRPSRKHGTRILPNRVTSRPEHYPPKKNFKSIDGKRAKRRIIVNPPTDPVKVATSLVDKIYLVIERAKKSQEHILIVCPFCNLAISPAKLIKHMLRVHPEEQEVRSLKTIEGEKAAEPQPPQAYLLPKRVSAKKSNSSGLATLVACPHCTAQVKSTKLQKHIAKVHPKTLLRSQQVAKKVKTIPNRKRKAPTQSSTKAGLGQEEGRINSLEAFRQSFDEQRDGSKGLGHMRRESNGRFGSYPLHDDYSDEADAA